jgi:GNAT superfamily N-acetyltransferase
MTTSLVGRAGAAEHVVVKGDPFAPDVAALLAASEAYAHSLYPAESVHMLDVAALTSASVCFLVAKSQAGVAHGCGAIALGPDRAGELKRMFVAPAARRLGLGARLLASLEAEAIRAGARVIRLETGVLQPEAIALYRRAGYVERGPFEPYQPDPLSVFMERTLP